MVSQNSCDTVGRAKADSKTLLIFIVCILIKIELQHEDNDKLHGFIFYIVLSLEIPSQISGSDF